MKRVLLTAFEPFGQHQVNSSQLCLESVLSQRLDNLEIESRLYPVDFESVRYRVPEDLQHGFDAAIHLGQTNKTGAMKFEFVALNMRKEGKDFRLLAHHAPHAHITDLALAKWVSAIEEAGIPVTISANAGTYVCNALYYWSLRTIVVGRLNTECCFIHVPLCEQQEGDSSLKLSTADAAKGLTAILQHIASPREVRAPRSCT